VTVIESCVLLTAMKFVVEATLACSMQAPAATGDKVTVALPPEVAPLLTIEQKEDEPEANEKLIVPVSPEVTDAVTVKFEPPNTGVNDGDPNVIVGVA
jgi:predicted NAD/FAD-dependent oxidoreductase